MFILSHILPLSKALTFHYKLLENQRQFTYITSLLLFLIISGTTTLYAVDSSSWAREVTIERRQRLEQLINQLNQPIESQQPIVSEIVILSKGPIASHVRSQLLAQLINSPISQIRQGCLDALVEIGDPTTLPDILIAVQLEPSYEVRIRMIQGLAAFIPMENPTFRPDIISASRRFPTRYTARVHQALRSPPYRLNRYNPDMDLTKQNIVKTISGQTDPVSSTIQLISSRRYGTKALATLTIFCGDFWGNTQAEWAEAWKTRESQFVSPIQGSLQSIRITASQTLVDIGAEVTDEVANQLLKMSRDKDDIIVIEALNTLRSLTTIAREILAQKPDTTAINDEAESYWRRQQNAVPRAERVSWEAAKICLESTNSQVRRSAALTAGTSNNPQVVDNLRRRLVLSGETPEVQEAIAIALSEIGGVEAVDLLKILAVYREENLSIAVQRQRYRTFITALSGLIHIAINSNDQASEQAFEAVSNFLTETRRVSQDPNSQEIAINDLTLSFLQQKLTDGSNSTDPVYWKKVLQSRRKNQR